MFRIAGFALLDEVGVLGVPAGIDEKRDGIGAVGLRHGPDIFHRDRLAAPGVIGDGQRSEGDLLRPDLFDQGSQLGGIQVAFEWVAVGRVIGFLDDQVGRAPAPGADVGVGRVKVHVGGDDHPRPDQDGGEDIFRGASLVGRDEMLETKDFLHHLCQAVIRASAGIQFIPCQHGRPLVLAHRPRPRIGQQVDEDIFGAQRKQVVASLQHGLPPFLATDQADRLDHFDPEWLGRVLRHTLTS